MVWIAGEMAVLSERIVLVFMLNMSYESLASVWLSVVGHLYGSRIVSISANAVRSFIVFLKCFDYFCFWFLILYLRSALEITPLEK